MIDIDANIEASRSILSTMATITPNGDSSATTVVLRQVRWAAETLLFALDDEDAVQSVRDLTTIAARCCAGEPGHWSQLWQLADETDQFIGGTPAALTRSFIWFTSLAPASSRA